MPGIGMGRSNNITWGLTAAIVDNSDLWKEELNEAGTHYLVDGEWRELESIDEVVKVKGQDDIDLKIQLTHRGPLVQVPELRFNAALLFGGAVPELMQSDDVMYSFGWGGAYKGETSFEFLKTITEAKDLPEFFARMEKSTEVDGYRGMAANLIMADNSGNIGYQLAVPMPVRKDQTPYLGCRVLDGRTSDFDWTDKLVPLKDLPRSINPKKGYLSNANNRQAPDHAS